MNRSLVYKYRLSELKKAIKAGVFKEIDFYDIEIDVKLLLDWSLRALLFSLEQ